AEPLVHRGRAQLRALGRQVNVHTPDGAVADAGAPAGRVHITIRGLSKRFGDHHLYTAFDLDIPRAQITSGFGPNGCGKSSLINMVAGLAPMDAGTVLFDGKPIERTVIGYVFQNYREALFPWKRALDNITYPLRLAGKPSAECAARAAELVQAFEGTFDLHPYPS